MKSENILTLLGTKHDNFSAIARAIYAVIRDMPDDDSWHACLDVPACETLARALATGRVELEFDADTITYNTMRWLNDGRIIHKFEERTISADSKTN